MEVLHIIGSRVILRVFCDHQVPESESCEIEMSISQTIFTKRNQKGLCGKKLYTLYKIGENIVVFIDICGARAFFLLFCEHQDTKSKSGEIETSIYQPKFTHKGISKSL